MDIETLYPLVTEAIRRAEIYDEIEAPGARDAHRDVSLLEERVADLLPASHSEGAVARRGAVRAAIAARDFDRAEMLAERYCADSNASVQLARELRSMIDELRRPSAADPARNAVQDFKKALLDEISQMSPEECKRIWLRVAKARGGSSSRIS
jgi:hypothetical protein